MNKKRILIVENSRGVTGALKSILRSSSHLKENYDFFFLIPKGGSINDEIGSLGFQTFQFNMIEIRRSLSSLLLYVPVLLINSWKFSVLVRKTKIDLIVVNDFYNLLPGIYAFFGGQIPYACYVRFLPSRFPQALLKVWITIHNRYSSRFIAVSNAVKRDLEKYTGKTVVIYNEIPLDDLSFSHSASKTMLYPANFTRGKGQEYALMSFAKMFLLFPDWRLKFVGGDLGLEKNRSFKRELMAMAASLKVEQGVEWTGFKKELMDEYLNCSIVLNFSDSESFSLTCLEGLFYGRPVIATRSGGPEEIIENEQTGFLVPIKDIETMTQCMIALAEDESLRKKMGELGFVHVREKFSTENTVKKLNDVYLSLLN